MFKAPSLVLTVALIATASYSQPLPITTNADPLVMSIRPKQELPAGDPAPLPIQRSWTLRAGKPVGDGLKAWAATANWTVIWSLQKDWIVPADTTFVGDFPDATEAAIKTLATNGALIRASINEGNRTVVVYGPGSQQQ